MLQAQEIIIAAFKAEYEKKMAAAIGMHQDLRKRPGNPANRVTFEVVCETLSQTWQQFPNEWLAAAFVHRKLMSWSEAARALGVNVEDLELKAAEMKEVVKGAIKDKIITADPVMIAEVWPERAWGRKRRRKAESSK